MVDELNPATRHLLLHRAAVGQVAGRTPSLTAAVARDGELLWCAGRGTVDNGEPDENTQYRIGSLTKTFTAVLIMRLRDEELLDLAAPVTAYLPELPLPGVTVAALLSHTGGLASETPPPWWERISGDVRPELSGVLWPDTASAPGRHFHYSNPGFAVLGAVAARLRGRPWIELVRAEILEPAGMTRTTPMPQPPHASGWAVHPWADVVLPEPAPDAGHMAPAGQLWSTATDLAYYAEVLLGARPDVLSKETAAEMRAPTSPPTDATWTGTWGLGLQLVHIKDRLLFGHGGSMPGFVSSFWVDPDQRLAGIVFANATGGPEVGAIAADLVDIVAAAQPVIPPAWHPLAQHDKAQLELVGPWYWGTSAVRVRLDADEMLHIGAINGRARESRFRSLADGTWVGLDGYYRDEILRVGRAADGTPNHLDVGSFVFARTPYDPAAPIPGDVDPDGWR